jgi:hypothetical protein
MRRYARAILAFSMACGLLACSKEVNLISDNEPFGSFNISDIKIENYVNRLYIDIIGREPLDVELEAEVDFLKENDLSRESRDSIIYKLMNDTTYRKNEFSYKAAYVQNLYNLAKVRCVEGVSDDEFRRRIGLAKASAFRDSLEGNWDGYFKAHNQIRRYRAALDSRQAFHDGLIRYHQMYAFMVDNGVYDVINMNTFNFVRATFDELLWRLPTEQEYAQSFNMIEFNQSEELFGKLGSDKNDYIQIVIESNEMLEGMVIWAYQVLLNRWPTSQEVVTLMTDYVVTKDINPIYSKILVTDEYANFR